MYLDRWSVESESDRLAFKPSVLLSLAAAWLLTSPSPFSPEPCRWSLIWQIEEVQVHLTASCPHQLRSHLVYPQLGNNGKFLEYLQEPMSTTIPRASPAFVVRSRGLEIEYADVKGPMPDQKQVHP